LADGEDPRPLRGRSQEIFLESVIGTIANRLDTRCAGMSGH
jgi:hypothetical protein